MTLKIVPQTSTAIKICGITELEQAKQISAFDINAIGIIGVKSSPRFISEKKRREIFSYLMEAHPEIMRVWVVADFEDEDLESGLSGKGTPSVVQLHGDESKGRCEELRNKFPTTDWWKALRIRKEEDLLLANSYENAIDYLLLDAWSPNALGGTGTRLCPEWLLEANLKVPWWIAGGISAEWVPELLSKAAPYGIDASSRLEKSPGIKDLKLVSDLIKAVKETSSKH